MFLNILTKNINPLNPNPITIKLRKNLAKLFYSQFGSRKSIFWLLFTNFDQNKKNEEKNVTL